MMKNVAFIDGGKPELKEAVHYRMQQLLF